jgi:predicted amidohydrolase
MKKDIRLAAAQIIDQNNFQANLIQHRQFIEVAGRAGVELLVFPELSLSGYHREQANSLALDISSVDLKSLRETSARTNVTAVVGCPLKVGNKIFIASIILRPDGTIASYCKQHLHPGEDHFFHPGIGGPAHLNDMSVALAICADTNQPEHAHAAHVLGANVYATSALISNGGYAHDSGLLQQYAVNHAFAVLLANHGGPTGGFDVAGKSAIWNEQGHCVSVASGVGSLLVIGQRTSGHWTGRTLAID